ncbi:hypothetical protein TNCV_4535971 [Trichonephila clavipes]|nr:hypothetical protein TNCV_4535971 [Trichonephila clavipes]
MGIPNFMSTANSGKTTGQAIYKLQKFSSTLRGCYCFSYYTLSPLLGDISQGIRAMRSQIVAVLSAKMYIGGRNLQSSENFFPFSNIRHLPR